MLETVPGLSTAIGMEQAMRFVRLATRLKDEILSVGHDIMQMVLNTLPESCWAAHSIFHINMCMGTGVGWHSEADARVFKGCKYALVTQFFLISSL